MASDSKAVGNQVTKEIESRLKQTPDHLFEAFLEIREPVDKEAPDVSIKYPNDCSEEILKTAPSFAYPCKMPPDEQSELFTFVVLDPTSTTFRFGFCRRSNREASCLCIISYLPWFETFYAILNDIAQMINSKALKDPTQSTGLTADMEQFLSSLYNYKLMSNATHFRQERKEMIEINGLSRMYNYNRPDPRKLPSMLSDSNFSVMFSRLSPDIMLRLFAHLLFERRILFVSSKLFHLTACAYGCLHLIYPMHWQSIFLPIVSSSILWTTACSAPYILGVHSSMFSTLNMEELGDVVIVNIDESRLESEYDDLSLLPKYLVRSMKKGIQQSSQQAGDHLARVFLRAMAFAIGNYANGFTLRNEKLDFDRDLYLEQHLASSVYTFMWTVANTQMFEQFSRYRTYAQLQRDTDVDEFDIEVKNLQQLQQSKKFKTNKKIYKLIEKYVKDGTIVQSSTSAQKDRTKVKKPKSLIDSKDDSNKAANPLLEQVHSKAEKLQTVINKAGQRVVNEASSVRSNLASIDINDVIKRAPNSKANDSIGTTQASATSQSDASDSLNGKSIPYERFNPGNGLLSPEPRLINGDYIPSCSSDSSRSSTPEPEQYRSDPLISLDTEDNLLQPSPIVLNVINTPLPTPTPRQVPQIDSKIRQLQSELQHKVQTFDGKRTDPRDEYGQQQTEIKKLVKQFDPFDDSNYFSRPVPSPNTSFTSMPVHFRSNEKLSATTVDRHPSIYETIPPNRVTAALQNIQTNYGTTSRPALRPTVSMQQHNKPTASFSPSSTAPAALFPKLCPLIPDDSALSFDPLAPSNEKFSYANAPSSSAASSQANSSNLIDFN